MCKAFVKMPRPYGDQSGGARKWAVRAGCETWFHSGGYHPPAASQFSPPSSKKTIGGKAKATARAKQLAVGTGSPEMPPLGGRRLSYEPFSPSSGHGGPSIGPAFDGSSRPAWLQAPAPAAPPSPPATSTYTPATTYTPFAPSYSHSQSHPPSQSQAQSQSLNQMSGHLHSHSHAFSPPSLPPLPFSYSLPRGYHYVPIHPQTPASPFAQSLPGPQSLGQHLGHMQHQHQHQHHSSSPSMHYLPTPPASSTHGHSYGQPCGHMHPLATPPHHMQGLQPWQDQSPTYRFTQPTQQQQQQQPQGNGQFYDREYEQSGNNAPTSSGGASSLDGQDDGHGSPESATSRDMGRADKGSPMTA